MKSAHRDRLAMGAPWSRVGLRGGSVSPEFARVIWRIAGVAAIVVAGTWAHYPGLHGGWLWDDDQYITENVLLRNSEGLAKVWLGNSGVNYFPVTSTAWWLLWQLFGAAPLPYHALNLILHLTSSLLLWRVASHVTAERGAWLGGFVFAIHPMTVESVAWASELKNTLSLPFWLLSLGCFLDGRRRIAWTFFLVSMLCKSSGVTLPLLLLLVAQWRKGRIAQEDLVQAAPFLLVSILFGAITLDLETHRAIGIQAVPLEGVGWRLFGIGAVVAFYLEKVSWPFSLVPIYPRWAIEFSWRLCLPWILVAAGGLVSCLRPVAWGRNALAAFGAFVLLLAPVLGVVPMAYLRMSWVADHFAYLPLACAAIFIGAVANEFRAGLWFVAALAALLGLQSRAYSRVFQSPETLWAYTISHNPSAWSAHNDLGAIRFDQGRLDEAQREFAEAIRLHHQYPEAYNNLGVAQAQAGLYHLATASYRQALILRPDYPEALCNLGNALMMMGHPDESVTLYQRALALRKPFPEAEYNLALARNALQGR